MTWNLFIDDERNVEDVTWAPLPLQEKYHKEDWIVCRNIGEVYDTIHSKGMPSYISFDHDLGEDETTGFGIVKMIIEMDLDEFREIPKDFDFYVHSMNPIGKSNIEGLLHCYIKAKFLEENG